VAPQGRSTGDRPLVRNATELAGSARLPPHRRRLRLPRPGRGVREFSPAGGREDVPLLRPRVAVLGCPGCSREAAAQLCAGEPERTGALRGTGWCRGFGAGLPLASRTVAATLARRARRPAMRSARVARTRQPGAVGPPRVARAVAQTRRHEVRRAGRGALRRAAESTIGIVSRRTRRVVLPLSEWRELGARGRREVRKAARRGQTHPDPYVAQLAHAWATEAAGGRSARVPSGADHRGGPGRGTAGRHRRAAGARRRGSVPGWWAQLAGASTGPPPPCLDHAMAPARGALSPARAAIGSWVCGLTSGTSRSRGG
jgi:hypothetical protein